MAKRSSRRRRKEHKKRNGGRQDGVVRMPGKSGKKDVEVLQVTRFDITWDPLPEPAVEALPEKVKQRKDRIFDLMQIDARLVEEEVRYLVAMHPEVPCFQNWHAKCLMEMGREEEARALVRRIVKHHPDYFSGRVMAAQIALWEDDLEEADRLLGFPKTPHGIAPDRSLFHISEVTGYLHVAGQYLLMKGKWEAALKCLEVMEEIAPDHRSTHQLGALCEQAASIITESMGSLLKTG